MNKLRNTAIAGLAAGGIATGSAPAEAAPTSNSGGAAITQTVTHKNFINPFTNVVDEGLKHIPGFKPQGENSQELSTIRKLSGGKVAAIAIAFTINPEGKRVPQSINIYEGSKAPNGENDNLGTQLSASVNKNGTITSGLSLPIPDQRGATLSLVQEGQKRVVETNMPNDNRVSDANYVLGQQLGQIAQVLNDVAEGRPTHLTPMGG